MSSFSRLRPVVSARPLSADSAVPPRPFARRIGDALGSRRAALVVPLIGMALTLPSLANGLAFDDLVIRARARGAFGASLWARLDSFAFFPSDPVTKARLTESGFIPWFAASDLHIAFFRPLSAALHFLDFTLFDRWPWVMHAESIALYGVVLALAGGLYRRLLPPRVATLAALFYAVDAGHGMPVGWLANRNALVAGAAGFAALLAHDRWRREEWRAGAILGPLAFAGAFLGGEMGLGALAYLIAHAATLERGGLRPRARASAPYLVITAVWQVAYRSLGYGARGTGLYVDPVADPAGFALTAPVRALTLLLAQLATPPADVSSFLSPRGNAALACAGLAAAAGLGWALRARLRTSAATRFFVLGMILSLAPAVATIPSNRLLLFTGVGGLAIVSELIGDAAGNAGSPRPLRWLLLALHLGLAPILLCGSSLASAASARWAEPLPAPAETPDRTVLLLNLPSVMTALPWIALDPRELRHRVRVLAGTTGRVAVTREDARTLVVELAPGAPTDPGFSLFRDDRRPLREGETYEVPGLRAEVLRLAADHHPASVRYRFARDLDDPSFRWVSWSGSFEEHVPPMVGTRLILGD
jgi:hypothetical protein